MIFTLIGADFSKSNIGTISSWMILRELGAGATYTGPAYVEKDAAFSATVTLAEKYEVSSAGISITMGGVALDETYYSIENNIITFNIAQVTGIIVIKVPTINTNAGSVYTLTIEPTPADATVTLTADGYVQVGNSISVINGTTVNWSVVADGYVTQSDVKLVTEDETMSVVLETDSGSSTLDNSWTSVTGTRVASSMITDTGKTTSSSGVVYDFTGYAWENYSIRVTCRYGTNTAMYAGGFWDADGNFLGGFWPSSGTSKVFTEVELTDNDLPNGVSWSDVATISLCATESSSSSLTVPVLEISNVIIAEGTNVASVYPGATQYETSSSGQVMEYSGYDWENYDIYATCRYGTTTTMYAIAVWGADDTYLGGIWLSDGTATVFTDELIEDSDLPTGVAWTDVEKLGLAYKSGVTPALKLVPKS